MLFVAPNLEIRSTMQANLFLRERKERWDKVDFFLALFSRQKCLIYTAFGHEDYLRIAYQLKANGVRFRTRTHTLHDHNSHHFGFFPKNDYTQYDIYVAKEDEYKAQMAIHAK